MPGYPRGLKPHFNPKRTTTYHLWIHWPQSFPSQQMLQLFIQLLRTETSDSSFTALSFPPIPNLLARPTASDSKTDPEFDNVLCFWQSTWSLSCHHLSPGLLQSTCSPGLHLDSLGSLLIVTRMNSPALQTLSRLCLKPSKASQSMRIESKLPTRPMSPIWAGPYLPLQPYLPLLSPPHSPPSSRAGLPSVHSKAPSLHLECLSTRFSPGYLLPNMTKPPPMRSPTPPLLTLFSTTPPCFLCFRPHTSI